MPQGRLKHVPMEAQYLVQVIPIGLIPKKNKPIKFRMIVDLSSPTGRNVNDSISSE